MQTVTDPHGHVGDLRDVFPGRPLVIDPSAQGIANYIVSLTEEVRERMTPPKMQALKQRRAAIREERMERMVAFMQQHARRATSAAEAA
jgi:hypothetical protein